MCECSEGERLTIELGRALREGEHKCKVFYMKLSDTSDNTEPLSFLCDWILCSGATVEKTKREILAQIASNEQQIEIPYNRCRLRRKCGSAPNKIFFDNQVFGDDIILLSNYEVSFRYIAWANNLFYLDWIVVMFIFTFVIVHSRVNSDYSPRTGRWESECCERWEPHCVYKKVVSITNDPGTIQGGHHLW